MRVIEIPRVASAPNSTAKPILQIKDLGGVMRLVVNDEFTLDLLPNELANIAFMLGASEKVVTTADFLRRQLGDRRGEVLDAIIKATGGDNVRVLHSK